MPAWLNCIPSLHGDRQADPGRPRTCSVCPLRQTVRFKLRLIIKALSFPGGFLRQVGGGGDLSCIIRVPQFGQLLSALLSFVSSHQTDMETCSHFHSPSLPPSWVHCTKYKSCTVGLPGFSRELVLSDSLHLPCFLYVPLV